MTTAHYTAPSGEEAASGFTNPYPANDATGTRSRRATVAGTDVYLALVFAVAVGSGGVARPFLEGEMRSGSLISVTTKADELGIRPESPEPGAPITTVERIAHVRSRLSLNVKQLAAALGVGRLAVYRWMKEGVAPRAQTQRRLQQIYEVAVEWRRHSTRPLGKYLVTPMEGGDSVASLLCRRSLEPRRIGELFGIIGSAVQAQADRKKRSGYKSAASVTRERGYVDVSTEPMDERFGDEGVALG